MKRKFVRIAAAFLAIYMMSFSFAFAEGTEEFIPEPIYDMWGNLIGYTTPPGTESGETDDPTNVPDEPDYPVVPGGGSQSETENGTIIKIGLFFNDKALPGGNLLNSVGSGYRFGYHAGNVFYNLGYTAETGISVLKAQNLYYSTKTSDNLPGYVEEKVSDIAVGCYHIKLSGEFNSFEQAKAAAASVGGFPAWIKGEYQVRIGAYLSQSSAELAANSLGIPGVSVVGTSSSAMTVVITGTSTPIFQYDGGTDNPMFTVKPGLDDNIKTVTHFKGYKYYGSFRYERIDGGNLTIVNLVDIEDYVRGVLPYEMSPSWPLEALKAQAVSARSYTIANLNHHSKYHFDLCNKEDCQVYYGTGSATEHTDRAAQETAGLYAWYGNEIILAVFHSNHGGATEDCENVWNQALPYLRGVIDPYEAMADTKPSYKWTKSYTGAQLKEILHEKGYVGASDIIKVEVSKTTNTGNPYSITFYDTNGKTWTVSHCENLRKMLGLKTIRYTVSGGGDGFNLTDDQVLQSLHGAWVLDGNGQLVQVNTNPAYAVTENGVQEVAGSDASAGTFVFQGAGSGHNLGMSQWGAYAMAKQGFTFDQILKFYYTGIEIHT